MVEISGLIGGLNFGGWGAGFGTFIKWVFWPIIIFGGMWLIWWLFTHNIAVRIYRPHENGSIGEKDKGKKTRDKDTRQIKGFKLLKYNKDYSGSPIDEKFFYPVKKMFGMIGYEVHMIMDAEGNLQPIMPPNLKQVNDWEGFKPADVAWHLGEVQRAEDRYLKKSGFMSMLAQAAPYIGLILVTVLMIVMFKQMEGITQGLGAIANQLGSINAGSQVI